MYGADKRCNVEFTLLSSISYPILLSTTRQNDARSSDLTSHLLVRITFTGLLLTSSSSLSVALGVRARTEPTSTPNLQPRALVGLRPPLVPFE